MLEGTKTLAEFEIPNGAGLFIESGNSAVEVLDVENAPQMKQGGGGDADRKKNRKKKSGGGTDASKRKLVA